MTVLDVSHGRHPPRLSMLAVIAVIVNEAGPLVRSIIHPFVNAGCHVNEAGPLVRPVQTSHVLVLYLIVLRSREYWSKMVQSKMVPTMPTFFMPLIDLGRQAGRGGSDCL